MDTFERVMKGVVEEFYAQVIKGVLQECYAQQAPKCTKFKDFTHDDGMKYGDQGIDANVISQQELSQISCNDRNTESTKCSDGNGCGCPTKCATSQQELPHNYCNNRKTESTENSNGNGCGHPIKYARKVQLQPPTCTKQCEQCNASNMKQCYQRDQCDQCEECNQCNQRNHCQQCNQREQCNTSSSWWQSWSSEKDCTTTQFNAQQPTPQVGCLGPRQRPQTRKNLLQCAEELQLDSICQGYPQASKISLDRFSRVKLECRQQSRLKPRVLQHHGLTRSCKAQNTLEAIMQTLICRKCPDIRCRKPSKIVNNWHLGICGGPKCRRSLKPANSLCGIDNLQKAILYMDNGDAMKKATEMNLNNWDAEDLQKAIRNIDNQNAIKQATSMCNIQSSSVREQLKTLSNWSTEDLQKELQDIDNRNVIKELARKYRDLLGLIKDHYRGKKAA